MARLGRSQPNRPVIVRNPMPEQAPQPPNPTTFTVGPPYGRWHVGEPHRRWDVGKPEGRWRVGPPRGE